MVIGQATRRLVGGLFELADLGPQRAQGLRRAGARPGACVGESRAESRFEALHGGAASRRWSAASTSSALLLDRWEQAKDGEGQVVLLSGEPGIGKSRLLRALRERLGDEPHTPLRYYCSPYHTNSALHPVIEQLERAAGFARDDPPERKLDKLEALLAPGDATTWPRRRRCSRRCCRSRPDARYPPLDLTAAAAEGADARGAGRPARAASPRAQPVLVLLEDVHWVDPTTLELLELRDRARRRRLPVLLLVTFRPEFAPPWTGYAARRRR